MKILLIHEGASLPTRGSDLAGGFDIYMPESGIVSPGMPFVARLGFAAEVPENHVALLLPRSGAGAKQGVELCNTCGVIDADYRGEWMATLSQKAGYNAFAWQQGDRILQFVIVPVLTPTLELVKSLTETNRGDDGFGSTGK